ncbi:fungal-specific transcription factor domain-containing protein [Dendryphion nanum]|uniref:Fungal-specific transcription factor domain-containing protein n=1 Tax=Dendryphion nanum TaxID=256645 RepID=A0A9P9IIE0_9PLEO|nr:fungal-specific transcription factor domain-containing protein [Dendryphion nanum]
MSIRSDSREASPDGGHDSSPEKRPSKKRKVLSCYACRNRKMKCDRVYPVCGRCQKTGRPDQCTYDPRLLDEFQGTGDAGHVNGSVAGANTSGFAQFDHRNNDFASANSAPSESVEWKLRVQERRLDALEKRLREKQDDELSTSLYPAMHRIRPDAVDHDLVSTEQMMFRGKGFKTHFYGSTSPFALITQFRELQSFTREALVGDNSMGRIKTDFKTFRERRKNLVKEKGQRVQGTNAEIFSALPEKAVVDAAVNIYFQTFETTYRILHEPSFWNEYHVFWENRNSEETPTSFATILVLIVASTKCLTMDRETLFVGDSSVDREIAAELIDISDAWLLRHSRKKLTLAFFQMQCLSLLAKRVNSIRVKQDWVNSGDVIRLAIASGLHRNPSLLGWGKITAFEMEMRRRLWATIMELELQSSVDLGHQSSLCGFFYDSQTPANLPDDAISTELEQLPAERPFDHFTSSSYLLLNNPTTKFEYSDVLHYDKEITASLGSLPAWDDSRSALAAASLDLQLRQFLLLIHQPYAVRASKDARFAYSFSACISAANSILTTHDNLLSKNILVLNHTRSDPIRAGIVLAQAVYHNSHFPTSPTDPKLSHRAPSPLPCTEPIPNTKATNPHKTITPGPPLRIPHLPPHNLFAETLITTAVELLERARAIFELKVTRLGTGYMEYWLISAAMGIMPMTTKLQGHSNSSIVYIPSSADDIASRSRKAMERLTSLCFRVLAMQKDPSSEFLISLRGTMSTSSPSDARSTGGSIVGNTPHGSTSVGDFNHGHGHLQPYIPGAEALARALEDGSKGSGIGDVVFRGGPGGQVIGGDGDAPWDSLQDMQVDLSGWNFPDFWAFDIGGDF